MINDQLKNYIKKAKENQIGDQQIADKLIASGWQKDVVMQAMSTDDNLPVPPPPSQIKNGLHYGMRDAFEHILLFISLYVMSSSIVLMCNYFIDIWFPGVVQGGSYDTSSASSYISTWRNILLRGYSASLIVSFPLFSFLFLRLTKRTRENPGLRSLKSRKQLIYLTLVVTFVIMLTSVIGIIFGFLGGNVTVNFVLRFAVTVGVSAIIFIYYLNQLREDQKFNA